MKTLICGTDSKKATCPYCGYEDWDHEFVCWDNDIQDYSEYEAECPQCHRRSLFPIQRTPVNTRIFPGSRLIKYK